MLQAGRSLDWIPDEVDFFNLPNPSSRTMALRSTQPLTEIITRNIPGGEGRPARKADKLTAICDPIVYKMWEPQHLTALWVSMARYRDTFTLPFFFTKLKKALCRGHAWPTVLLWLRYKRPNCSKDISFISTFQNFTRTHANLIFRHIWLTWMPTLRKKINWIFHTSHMLL
jgi:hypothetical protein